MKSLSFFASFLLFLLATSLQAEPYSRITDRYTAQGCVHYEVTVWDDMNTPDDPSDDIELGSNVIRDCDRGEVDGSVDDDKSKVTKVYYQDQCAYYRVKITNYQGVKLTSGSVIVCDTE